MTVTGTLTNAGRINIGGSNLSASTTVTAGALQNTGSLYVFGSYTTGSTNQAALDILSAAPTNWTGFLDMGGDALVEFSQGSIQSIAAGGEIRINTTTSFFANASATTQNSALAGLTSNAGDFELQDAASASLSGALDNTGTISLDNDTNYGLDANGGSTLAIAGALANAGRINIGNAILGSSVLVTAASLDNTGGQIYIVGDNAKGTEATLDIAGAAPTTLTGFVDLGGRDSHGGNSLLEFGSGKITAIASGAVLYLANPTSFVADADDILHDSALTSLASNAGEIDLQDAAAPAASLRRADQHRHDQPRHQYQLWAGRQRGQHASRSMAARSSTTTASTSATPSSGPTQSSRPLRSTTPAARSTSSATTPKGRRPRSTSPAFPRRRR